MKEVNPEIFREYDVRGVFQKDFDLDFAHQLGRGFVKLLRECGNTESKPKVCVGYDARLSSPDLANSLAQGLCEAGADVLELGLVTTPMAYFSTFALADVSGAIMVTGSHNPPEYNGFKISVGKSTIYGEKILRLKSLCYSEDVNSISKGKREKFDIFPLYVEKHRKEFGCLSPIEVVLDCGNGAAGIVARRLYEAVGLKPTILYEKPDGTFPNHHPDPTVFENLKNLVTTVKDKRALVGIGFDGDADRIGVVDDKGQFVLGDELLTIFSRDLLSKVPGQKVVGDVKCSDRMFKDIEERGGHPIMWKTGHSLIKEKIRVEASPFGGELSGHIFFSDRNYGYDDALYAGLRLIEIISSTGKTISQLLEGLPKAYNTPEIRIDTTEKLKLAAVDAVINRFKERPDVKLNRLDGVRISYSDGWALVRASNTQPVVVLRFEAWTQGSLDRIRGEIEPLVERALQSEHSL